jgi:hypothetical protein
MVGMAPRNLQSTHVREIAKIGDWRKSIHKTGEFVSVCTEHWRTRWISAYEFVGHGIEKVTTDEIYGRREARTQGSR